MTVNAASKFGMLIQATYNNYNGGDREVGQCLSSANLQNYFNGFSVGLNSLSGDLVGGVVNRQVSFKEKQFFEENGLYPDPTKAWVA